ncbi:toprim domain-containing protein [Prauserella endophytica]|uniref:Toprim domain-containing protein n=1 Tax=Prauserella endophytica TaxID=1592324 RepID=A0ABY2RWN8_9PSEU|nr:toprim domain-containing protein [Prauserella endophytica]TKG61541.1 toprim domain-containing protein [Prauserella endophytica]
MAGTDRPRARSEERQRREQHTLAELRGHLDRMVPQLGTDTGWQAWVEMSGRFPQGEFSVDNLMLLMTQRPDATAVAPYQGWQDLGRQVSKGEHGIAILDRPLPLDGRVENVRPAYVFDRAQTHPLPDHPGMSGQRVSLSQQQLHTALLDVAAQPGLRPIDGVLAGVEQLSTGDLAEQLARQVLAPTQPGQQGTAGLDAQAAAVRYLVLRAHNLTPPGYDGPAPSADPRQAYAAARRVLAAAQVCLQPTLHDPQQQRSLRALLERGHRAQTEASALAERSEVAAALADRPVGPRARSLEQVGERDLFPATDRLARLEQVNVAAAAFYRDQLAVTPHAQQYMRDRVGDGRALPPGFVVGYASPGWTALLDHLRAAGFADKDLLDAGVVQQTGRGTLIDRFRDRVLVGLRDEQGRLAGFIGRTLDPNPSESVPKYLNTNSTELFDKGKALLGLHEQRQALAEGSVPVVMEGPFDVLAVAAATGNGGRVAPVATSGTAVSPEQIAAIATASRSGTLVFAHDGDAAGRAATVRAVEMTLPLQRDVRAAVLPEGHDPASWARAHPGAALAPYLDQTRTRRGLDLVVDARIEAFADHLQFVDGRVDAMRHAVRVLDGQPPQVVAEQALRIAQRLDLDPVTVAEELGEVPKSDRAAQRAVTERARQLSENDPRPDRHGARPHPAALAHMASPTVPAGTVTPAAGSPPRRADQRELSARAGDERGR